MDNGEFREELEIAISRGGFRATAFGLGVLLYLVDRGLNQRVKSITSVSGGSITNGFVASECKFGSLRRGLPKSSAGKESSAVFGW